MGMGLQVACTPPMPTVSASSQRDSVVHVKLLWGCTTSGAKMGLGICVACGARCAHWFHSSCVRGLSDSGAGQPGALPALLLPVRGVSHPLQLRRSTSCRPLPQDGGDFLKLSRSELGEDAGAGHRRPSLPPKPFPVRFGKRVRHCAGQPSTNLAV
eukprot:4487338-Amphidinium_carterae.1